MRTLVLLMVLAVLARPIEAGFRARCRQQCDATVAACVTSTGQRLRACRRQTLRRCRHEGLQVCAPPTTTTTTTVPGGRPTTTQPHGAPTTVPHGSTTTSSTTTTTTLRPRLTFRVLAWKRYDAVSPQPCPAYEGILVQFVTSGTSGTHTTDGTTPEWWELLTYYGGTYYGCSLGQIAVPDSVRRDFFSYGFPFVTTDATAGQPCSASLRLPGTGSLLCTLFMGRASQLYDGTDYLIFNPSDCGEAQVAFGCQTFGGCTPLPVSSGAVGCAD